MRYHHSYSFASHVRTLSRFVLLLALLPSFTQAQEPKVRDLIDDLRSPDVKRRRAAAEALNDIESNKLETAVPQLAEALSDKDEHVRFYVALTFNGMGAIAEAAIPQLIEALKDSNEMVRSNAADALGEIGTKAEAAIPHLIEALKDRDDNVRSNSASSLGRIGGNAETSIPQLIQALKDEKIIVRHSAAFALGLFGPKAEAAVPQLIETLKNRDKDVRYMAVNALGNIGDKAGDAVTQLTALLEDDNEHVRTSAGFVLGKVGDKAEAVVPRLIELLKDEDKSFRRSAANACAAMGVKAAAAIPQLAEALNDKDEEVRRDAARALGRIGPKAEAGVPQIIEALGDSDKEVRINAASALGEIGEKAEAAVPRLIELLKDEDKYMRGTAASSLGKIGAKAEAAVPPLADALSDKEEGVRRAAAAALDEFSTKLAARKVTVFSKQLKVVADIMRDSSDPKVRSHEESVRQASDLLRLLWWEQLKLWARTHPALSSIIIVFPLLLLVWLTLLWLFPLSLLQINEALAKAADFRLPDKLGGFNVAPRYLILAGFFHYHPRVLDAWVSKHVNTARRVFSSLPTVEEREVHVPLPVVLGKEPIANFSPDVLRPAFSGSFVFLRIRGEGGAGKTSLACQLAAWSMLGQKESRLCPEHAMLPVLIEQDIPAQGGEKEHPLFSAVGQQIKMLVGDPDPPASGLLRQLLRKRRVLVIIDGFSEMGESSRECVLVGIADLPVNAVVLTSRTDEPLNGILTTEVTPQRVRGNHLSTFMESYLTARKKRDLFEDDEFFEACRRLSLIVGDRDITALLAKLYAEQMIATKEGAAGPDAPANIPELMLSYLNALFRGAGPDIPDIRAVHRAAKTVAWECLRNTLRPVPARREEVVSALGGGEKAEPLLDYLEKKLRVIQTVGAGRDRVRFALDPLAEYLAGMYLIEANGEDEQVWRIFLAQVDVLRGEPEDIKGFLLAVRDCCLAEGDGSQSLRTAADELAKRAGISPEESDRYRIENRVRQLMARLKYSEARDRLQAAEELGSIGMPAKIAVKDLCVLLRDQDESIRRSATDALMKIGVGAIEAVPHLIASLNDAESFVRMGATNALGEIGKGAKDVVVPQLIEALKDPVRIVRVHAASALGKIGERTEEAVLQLTAALGDTDEGVHISAALALQQIGEGAE